jgi:hypothetical protein
VQTQDRTLFLNVFWSISLVLPKRLVNEASPYYRGKKIRPMFEMVTFYSLGKIGEYFDLNT